MKMKLKKLPIADCRLPIAGGGAGGIFSIGNRKSEIENGFTLVEMILAIGVAAIVLAAVNAVLFTALHLREVTTDVVDAATPLDQTVTFLRRDLECCVTPTNGTSKVLSGAFRAGNGLSSAGVSDPVAVEMFTATGALSESVPWADIQRVTYEVKNSTDISGRRDLYRSVLRNLLPTGTPEVDEQLMLPGVESVKFSCYDGAQWQDAWDTSDATSVNTNLPLAVRVQIQMAGGNANEPIQLVVPIDAVARTNRVITTGS
jgi:type II secretion system protein J